MLEKLGVLGVSAVVEGDELVLRPGSKIPTDMLPELRVRKPEIVDHLRRQEIQGLHQRYQYRNPQARSDQAEWDEIRLEVYTKGSVLLWSEVLNDFIGVYATEYERDRIPPGFVQYSSDELWHIFGEGKPDVAENTIRLLHRAKVLGARISESYPGEETDDDKAE